jgi:hypothetical protein
MFALEIVTEHTIFFRLIQYILHIANSLRPFSSIFIHSFALHFIEKKEKRY